jgi:Leucine-rich repeat (LRR) protein
MKLTCRFVFSLLLFFSVTTLFSQNLSDQETGFDAARITVTLKKRGLTDQNIQEEVALMRKLHNEQYAVMKKKENEQYAAIKKSEDAILQKITSEQALKTEANKTVNTGLTAKTASTLLTDIPQTEKEALLALYNSTNGNNWTNKTGWDFSTPVTSGWFGITVGGGHVTGISLGNNKLSGTIPTEIGQLTQLEHLYLNNNELNGVIPATVGQLIKIRNLNLGYNQISGPIPTEITQLTQLTSLYLNNNKLTGTIPNTIGRLTQLQILCLHVNQLSGKIPAAIGQLTLLQNFYLNQNQLDGIIPVEIGQLTKLQNFYLDTNQLSGKIPTEIGQLTQIQNLNLQTNQLNGTIPSEIGLLTKLKILRLNNNQLSGAIPNSIGQLTQLQNIYLHNNQLSGTIPTEIGQLTQILEIYLYNNQLRGTIPFQIGQLTKLTSLALYLNQLSGKIPAQIGQLTQLQNLWLQNNQLSGTIPAEIGQLTNLQNLYLYTNKLNGTIPVEIGQLTQLQTLHLQQNELIGIIPTSVGQLINLTSLLLSTNSLSGTIPVEIGQLTKLTSLYLSTNKLTGTIPVSIGQLTKLKSLYLNYNQLSGTIPNQIGLLPQILELYLYNNQFEGKIPDLTNVISNLSFQNNKFRFVDFASEYNAYKSKPIFIYSNQAKTDSEITITKTAGETQTLTMYEDDRFTPADTYQWYKNGTAIAGATSRQYTLASLTLANAGDYYCVSKNPQMTIAAVTNQNLILTRNTIHLNVSNCNAILSSAIGTDIQTICNSAAITPITYTTAGLITGATFSGLPNGVTGNFASNIVTISGTPAYAGTFPYTVTYIGNCGSAITSKGTITVQTKTVNAASAAPVVCKNTAIAPITHRTSGGTLTLGTPSGLPSGVTPVWGLNLSSTTSGTLTISGTPTNSGVFNYSIPLLGGCGDTINAVGTITVSEPGTITLSSPIGTNDQSKNVNTIITPITYITTGTTGANITGLPAGVTGTFASNTVTISGTPTASGTFTYLITLTGDCNTTITGKITALCEPITGIIKIINTPTASYPFQFSNSNSTSSEACAQTTFPLELYAATPTLGVGSTLYWNDKLTSVYNAVNQWHKESTTGISYSIGNSGQIGQAFNCTPTNCNANVTANQSSQTISSRQTTAITLSSTTVGTIFSWTVVQSGVTGAAAGTGNSINQTLTNNGTTNGTATYTITPALGNCTGTAIVVVITVTPASQSPSIVVNNAICAYTGGAQLPISYYNTPPGSYITMEVTHRDGSANLTMDESSGYYMLNYFGSSVVNSTVYFILYLYNSSGEVIYQTNQTLARRSNWSQLGACQL